MTGTVTWAWISLVLGISWLIMFTRSMKKHQAGEVDGSAVVLNVLLLFAFWGSAIGLSTGIVISQ